MPLSKEKNRERMRIARLVQPKIEAVQPKVNYGHADINESIVDQCKRLYPNGELPNCPDGRYREPSR